MTWSSKDVPHGRPSQTNPPDRRAVSQIPFRPKGGETFCFRGEGAKAEDWRADGHRRINQGTVGLPRSNPQIKSRYFYIATESTGASKDFVKFVFNQPDKPRALLCSTAEYQQIQMTAVFTLLQICGHALGWSHNARIYNRGNETHLSSCLESNNISPFTYVRATIQTPTRRLIRSIPKVFCSCRGPEDGLYVICNKCHIWYYPQWKDCPKATSQIKTPLTFVKNATGNN